MDHIIMPGSSTYGRTVVNPFRSTFPSPDEDQLARADVGTSTGHRWPSLLFHAVPQYIYSIRRRPVRGHRQPKRTRADVGTQRHSGSRYTISSHVCKYTPPSTRPYPQGRICQKCKEPGLSAAKFGLQLLWGEKNSFWYSVFRVGKPFYTV